MKNDVRKIVALASLGGALDFYDFVVFGVFSPYLSRHFFPAGDPLVSLMKTFGVFAVGYLVRPLGGLFFSHVGDRVGRKRSLLVSMLLMSLSTLGMGLLPTYETAGLAASLVFVFFRLVQGFSLGGEIPGAITFATEALPSRRGTICGLIFFCINMGLFGGSAVHELLLAVLPRESVEAWAWRLPFILGGVFGMLSYRLRRQLQETRAFAESAEDRPRIPFLELLRDYPRALVGGCLVTALGATLIALCFIYLPTYFSEILHYPPAGSVRSVNISLFVFSFLIALVGWLSDRVSRLRLYFVGALALAVFARPFFGWIASGPDAVLAAMLALAFVGAPVTGTFPAVLSEIFPERVRFSGVSLGYNLPYAFFGGIAPLAATALVRVTGSPLAPFAYLLGAAVLGLAGAIVLRGVRRF